MAPTFRVGSTWVGPTSRRKQLAPRKCEALPNVRKVVPDLRAERLDGRLQVHHQVGLHDSQWKWRIGCVVWLASVKRSPADNVRRLI